MYFSSLNELKQINPFSEGIWNKNNLYEYLICISDTRFKDYVENFFNSYLNNAVLADLLFDFLLDFDYDGSDCQIGAAYILSRMDKALLKSKKDLLLIAQTNEVHWKRPFKDDEDLSWLDD